jgi:hypothetical protein
MNLIASRKFSAHILCRHSLSELRIGYAGTNPFTTQSDYARTSALYYDNAVRWIPGTD